MIATTYTGGFHQAHLQAAANFQNTAHNYNATPLGSGTGQPANVAN